MNIVQSLKLRIDVKLYCSFQFASLREAARQQGLEVLREELCRLVPNITDQYSSFKVDNPYLHTKVRNLHAFQVSLVKLAMDARKKAVIVDIGDSSGAHLKYITALYSSSKDISCLGVNIDQQAVDRIKARGLKAIKARAEELDKYDIHADIFLCFETLEHLMDPIRFLYELSSKTKAEYLIITVPYVRSSRTGLYHIRRGERKTVYAENTHIFEFCPEDWKLLMTHAGWSIYAEKIYTQYPIRGIYSFMRTYWQRFDFEGFFGVVLKRDPSWACLYKDW